MASAEALAAVHITKFLAKTEERAEFNQYYYSKNTLRALVGAIRELKGAKIAFLSTPSVYFSLAPKERAGSYVFDLDDEQFGKDPRFVKYDFNKPTEFPEELRGSFDAVVIDPPFITRDVWEQYLVTSLALLRVAPHSPADASAKVVLPAVAAATASDVDTTAAVDGTAGTADVDAGAAEAVEAGGFDRGLVLLSTIAENKEMMAEMFGVAPTPFRPCIPHLVYQYELYTNFEASALSASNPEVPDPEEC